MTSLYRKIHHLVLLAFLQFPLTTLAAEIVVDRSNLGENILGIPSTRLRNGDITMADIPLMIASVIETLLAIAGVVAVVALIYHAVRMQLASGITGDSSGVDKAKSGMKGALLGFILAMSAWFLMTRLIGLISTNT